MKTTKMTFKTENLSKQTPKLWKRIGDVAIYTLPMWQAAVIASPLSADARMWIGFGIALLLPAIKGITKFFAYEEVNE